MEACLTTSGQGMQDPIPEYYFTENGEDCFGSGKAVQTEEHIFTKMHQHCQEGQANPSVCVSFL